MKLKELVDQLKKYKDLLDGLRDNVGDEEISDEQSEEVLQANSAAQEFLTLTEGNFEIEDPQERVDAIDLEIGDLESELAAATTLLRKKSLRNQLAALKGSSAALLLSEVFNGLIEFSEDEKRDIAALLEQAAVDIENRKNTKKAINIMMKILIAGTKIAAKVATA